MSIRRGPNSGGEHANLLAHSCRDVTHQLARPHHSREPLKRATVTGAVRHARSASPPSCAPPSSLPPSPQGSTREDGGRDDDDDDGARRDSIRGPRGRPLPARQLPRDGRCPALASRRRLQHRSARGGAEVPAWAVSAVGFAYSTFFPAFADSATAAQRRALDADGAKDPPAKRGGAHAGLDGSDAENAWNLSQHESPSLSLRRRRPAATTERQRGGGRVVRRDTAAVVVETRDSDSDTENDDIEPHTSQTQLPLPPSSLPSLAAALTYSHRDPRRDGGRDIDGSDNDDHEPVTRQELAAMMRATETRLLLSITGIVQTALADAAAASARLNQSPSSSTSADGRKVLATTDEAVRTSTTAHLADDTLAGWLYRADSSSDSHGSPLRRASAAARHAGPVAG